MSGFSSEINRFTNQLNSMLPDGIRLYDFGNGNTVMPRHDGKYYTGFVAFLEHKGLRHEVSIYTRPGKFDCDRAIREVLKKSAELQEKANAR